MLFHLPSPLYSNWNPFWFSSGKSGLFFLVFSEISITSSENKNGWLHKNNCFFNNNCRAELRESIVQKLFNEEGGYSLYTYLASHRRLRVGDLWAPGSSCEGRDLYSPPAAKPVKRQKLEDFRVFCYSTNAWRLLQSVLRVLIGSLRFLHTFRDIRAQRFNNHGNKDWYASICS